MAPPHPLSCVGLACSSEIGSLPVGGESVNQLLLQTLQAVEELRSAL